MAKTWGSQQNFSQIPVLGFVPEKGATAPASPVEGQQWIDTSSSPNRLKVYEGGAWVVVSNTGTELTANKGVANGYAPLDGSGDVPLANLPVATSGTSSATQIPRADDSRLSNARTPTGTAGGDLTGSYPNPTIAALAVTDAKVAAANKDGAVGTPSMRTLGTGAQQALAGNTRLDQIAAPTASINLNSQTLTNLGSPVNPADAARLADVQAAQAGIDNKPSVRAVATANVATLSGTTTIDGVALVAGDRVLLTAQTTASQNGPYVIAAGAWTRPAGETVTAQSFWMVEEGTSNAGSQWKVNTSGAITLGTTALAINQWGAAGTVYSGTANRVTVSGSVVDISAAYAGQTSINTVGTVTTGTWQGTAVDVAHGGTGATTAAGARTALGTVGKFDLDLGALTAGSELLITHGLNTPNVQSQFFEVATGKEMEFEWRKVGTTQIGVTPALSFAASAIHVTVMG